MFLCFLRASVDDRMVAAIDHDFTCFKLLDACQNFDQGGFSCAVFTHQCMNLAFFQCEIHILQSFYTREGFVNMSHFENGILFHKSGASFLTIKRRRRGGVSKPPALRLLIIHNGSFCDQQPAVWAWESASQSPNRRLNHILL